MTLWTRSWQWIDMIHGDNYMAKEDLVTRVLNGELDDDRDMSHADLRRLQPARIINHLDAAITNVRQELNCEVEDDFQARIDTLDL